MGLRLLLGSGGSMDVTQPIKRSTYHIGQDALIVNHCRIHSSWYSCRQGKFINSNSVPNLSWQMVQSVSTAANNKSLIIKSISSKVGF